MAMAVCLAPGAAVFVPTVSFAAVPSFHTSLDPSKVKESMQYLVKTFGVSEAEALRRLELQNDAQALHAMLSEQSAASYGGMSLDHDNGGVLVLSTTRPADVEAYVASMPDRAHVRTRTVKRSLQALEQTRETLAKQVGEGADSVYVTSVDTENNSVVMWERGWVAESKSNGTWAEKSGRNRPTTAVPGDQRLAVSAEKSKADAAVKMVPTAVERRVLPEPKQSYTPYIDWGTCHPLYCKSVYGGMRGGLRLNIRRDNGTTGGCTAGFNVRSGGGDVNGWGWVLTAGHCVVGKTNTVKVHHNGYNILNPHGVAGGYYMEVNSYPYDFAFLNYISGTESGAWLENWGGTGYRNSVLKYCRNGGQDSNADTPCGNQATEARVTINGYHALSAIGSGWIVCASGSGSDTANYPESYDSGAGDGYLVGTRCGRVLSKDVGINTDVCARAGDSGGPLFSQLDNKAYGILEGDQQSRSGPCASGEKNNYTAISKIYELMETWRTSGYTGGAIFRLITGTNG
ncbi:hypothetical protein [Micromonospora saelicesensis]|uniref:hypothetical protein n=1 Tax=Micromonospora saelicesensis TaxID=285676 RepID=UPI000B843B29|nr:hypothetical protein [Micromonospora saelicesensis]